MADTTVACEWCGRAIYRGSFLGRPAWLAVKGVERGYNPETCEVSDDVAHDPGASVPTPPWRHEDDHCAHCDGYLDPMNSEVIAARIDAKDLIWCGKECLTPWVIAEAERRTVTASQTDRQPPASSSVTKGGETPVAPAETKRPDVVTHHEETHRHVR